MFSTGRPLGSGNETCVLYKSNNRATLILGVEL